MPIEDAMAMHETVDGESPLASDQVDVVPVASTRQTGLRKLTLTDQVLADAGGFLRDGGHEARILQESDHHPNVIRYFVKLNHKDVLQQAMRGVQHLHSMQIVHRDIKPQNILIGGPQSKKDTRPRVLISDFGLGKRLADDHSSFTHTAARGGGTAGWRPREVLEALAGDMDACDDPPSDGSSDDDDDSAQAPTADVSTADTPPADTSTTSSTLRMSRAVDVFACGCVFYYVLSGGKHPFGNKLMCEANIMRGNYRLDALDALGPEGVLAKDVIRRMIAQDPKKRPDATAVLHHPFFWSASQRLAFLGDLSDRLESEPRDAVNVSPLVKLIERGGSKVTGGDWQAKMDASVVDGGQAPHIRRDERGGSAACTSQPGKWLQTPLPSSVTAAKAVLGQQPEGLLAYYETRFPLLLLHCYAAVSSSKTLRSDSLLSAYCQYPPGSVCGIHLQLIASDSQHESQRADSLFLDDSTQADELDKRSDSDGDSDGESDGDSDGDDDDSFDDNPSASDRARSGQAGGRQAANRVDDSRSRNRVDDNPSASDRAAARRGGRRNRTAPSTA
ncbi:kinase-like domain-containing protein [Entophlyctis helioformis]|nr:kinase-like domain-containing protein [Entophlyctis helioformis]